MNDQVLEIIITLILFLIASYFIFYKSWLTALGNEIAKLSTVEQLTKIAETVKKDITEQIENYKSKLNEELALKIEPLKSQLAKNNISHQIQFDFLHRERAKFILELYKKLVELHSAMVDWTSFMHPIIEDGEKESQARTIRANTALQEFRNFYLLNKLFLPKSFCDYMDQVFKDYWSHGWDFGYKQERIKSGELTHEDRKQYAKDMSKISKELRINLPLRITEIETMFRKILNVEDEK